MCHWDELTHIILASLIILSAVCHKVVYYRITHVEQQWYWFLVYGRITNCGNISCCKDKFTTIIIFSAVLQKVVVNWITIYKEQQHICKLLQGLFHHYFQCCKQYFAQLPNLLVMEEQHHLEMALKVKLKDGDDIIMFSSTTAYIFIIIDDIMVQRRSNIMLKWP